MEIIPSPGKLKIFLGYAPAVGKTHAMLDAALRKSKEGVKVAIGCFSTHDLEDYEDLLAGFEKGDQNDIPASLQLDDLLVRKPGLVVVDDLAARNPPMSRHPLRYQDVEELLSAGIDVFSTLNVQELESLRDVITSIDPTMVVNTIPDRIFREASVIELIDLPAEELIQRLERKIADHQLDSQSVASYLSEARLTKLREIALLRAAGSIEMQFPIQSSAGEKSQATGGILVCVSSHPISEKLVRAGKRTADERHLPWYVLYIETPERSRPIPANRDRLERSLKLAEELGATVHRRTALDVSRAIAGFVHYHRITRVIIGAPRRSFSSLFGRTPMDKLISLIGSTEILIIKDDHISTLTAPMITTGRQTLWIEYLKALGIVTIVTLISFPLHLIIDPVNLVMLYLLGVMASAFYLGRGPAIFTSLTSVLAFDFFLVLPRFSLTIADTQYLLTFFGFIVISLVISGLAGKVHAQVDASRQREELVTVLYTLSQELTEAYDRNMVINVILNQIRNTFVKQCTLWLLEGEKIQSHPDNDSSEQDGIRPVKWSIENRRPAGKDTDTYPELSSSYYPLVAGSVAVGVIEVSQVSNTVLMNSEKRSLLEAYCGIAALAIERTRLVDAQKKAQLVLETERLQNTLLNSISHDLRTPLATISGVLSSLRESEQPDRSGASPLPDATRLELLESGWEETQRLNRIVGNLLDITRLESGALKLNLQSGDLEGVLGAVLARLKPRLAGFELKVNIAPDLPRMLFDPGLIEQVLTNILDNAIKFSVSGKKLEIQILSMEDQVLVSIKDQGSGIPNEDLVKIFDKFYRAKGAAGISGSGLGLSICKGIIQAHGGRIWAEANTPHGIIMNLTLPVKKELHD